MGDGVKVSKGMALSEQILELSQLLHRNNNKRKLPQCLSCCSKDLVLSPEAVRQLRQLAGWGVLGSFHSVQSSIGCMDLGEFPHQQNRHKHPVGCQVVLRI